MAKTTFILEADEAKAVNAFLKLAEAQNKTIDGTRKFNREGDNFGKGLISGIGQVAAGFGIATSAMGAMHQMIGVISKELEDLRRKENEAANATVNYAKNFSQTIGDWLGADKIDKAHAALARLVREMPEVGYTTGQAMLAAYGSRKPSAGLERGMAAVKMAAPLAYGREDTLKLVGELEEIFPGKTMEDVFDVAIGLQRRAGKHKEEIEEGMKAVHRMTAVGIPGEQAMGVLMAAFEEEQAGRAVQAMAKLPLALREKRPAKFKKMTEGEILNWAMTHPEETEKYMGTSWAMIAPIMKPGAIAGWTKTVEQVQTDNEYQKRLISERESALATTARIAARRSAAIEGLQIGATPEAIIGFTRKTTEDLLKSTPGIGATERRLLLAAIGARGRLGGEYAQTAVTDLTALQQEFAAPTRMRQRMVSGFRGDWQGAEMIEERNPRYAPAIAEAIGNLIRDISEQAAAFNKMGGLAGNDHTKALQDNTRAINKLVDKMASPGVVPILLNSGLVD